MPMLDWYVIQVRPMHRHSHNSKILMICLAFQLTTLPLVTIFLILDLTWMKLYAHRFSHHIRRFRTPMLQTMLPNHPHLAADRKPSQRALYSIVGPILSLPSTLFTLPHYACTLAIITKCQDRKQGRQQRSGVKGAALYASSRRT